MCSMAEQKYFFCLFNSFRQSYKQNATLSIVESMLYSLHSRNQGELTWFCQYKVI